MAAAAAGADGAIAAAIGAGAGLRLVERVISNAREGELVAARPAATGDSNARKVIAQPNLTRGGHSEVAAAGVMARRSLSRARESATRGDAMACSHALTTRF